MQGNWLRQNAIGHSEGEQLTCAGEKTSPVWLGVVSLSERIKVKLCFMGSYKQLYGCHFVCHTYIYIYIYIYHFHFVLVCAVVEMAAILIFIAFTLLPVSEAGKNIINTIP